MKKLVPLAISIGILLMLSSCGAYLDVRGVAYQSVRQANMNSNQNIPDTAQILVTCHLNFNGIVEVKVTNLTDKMMTIDRTKSFFTNKGQTSQMYYDPAIHSTVTSNTVSSTGGVTTNLGAVANAVGIGGKAGTLLSGVNVSKGSGVSSTTTNTSMYIDQPTVAIPSKGSVSMGRPFLMNGIGSAILEEVIATTYETVNNTFTPQNTYAAATIVVSYTIEGEANIKQIETTLYANTCLMTPVTETGKVNQALRSIYTNKPTVYEEPWYMFQFGKKGSFVPAYSANFVNYK